ncbi:MAG TPA: AAA family ATPase [Candidatus Dormibacteraeota bacterium]
MTEGRFVGRANEMRELNDELREVVAGHTSRTVVVSGLAGIGKTRLVTEFRSRSRHMADWYVGRATPNLSMAPMAAVVEATGAADSNAETVSRRLSDLASSRPVVLWLDDIHAADAGTLHLVSRVGRAPIEGRVLVLVTFRTDAPATSREIALTVGALLKDGLAREIRVPPLDEAETARIAELVLGATAMTADLSWWLFDRTRGNPLMLTAVLDDLAPGPERRSTAATVQERTWVLLASLSDDAIRAAEVAAVLGSSFTVPELLVVQDDAGAGLDRLVGAGLLVQDPADRRLAFAHPIVQEAVYDMTGPARRTELHALIADRLPLDSGRRAYHLARSARPGDVNAIEALRQAARDALRAGSPSVAIGHLRDALELVPPTHASRRTVLDQLAGAADAAGDHTAGVPAVRELLRGAGGAEEQVTARLRLASFVSAGGGDLVEAERLVYEAVSLARAQVPQRLSMALTELAWIRGESGDLGDQARLAAEACALAERGHDRDGQLRALGPLAHGQAVRGLFELALDANERALSLARSMADPGQLAWHTCVRGQVLTVSGNNQDAVALVEPLAGSATDTIDSNLAYFYWQAGRWRDALAAARRLLATAPPQVPVRTAWSLAIGAAVEAAAGRPAAARALLAVAERSYGGRDFYSFSALHDWAAGMAASILGEPGLGLPKLQRSADWLRRMGAGGLLPFVLSDLCCVAVAAGATDVARDARARAEQLDGGGSRVGRAAALACAAVLDGVDLRTAAAIVEEVGMRPLAAMLLARGDVDDVAEAARMYAAMRAPVLETRCLDTLRARGSLGVRAAREAGSLTRRESEVVVLARRGLTTAAIALSLKIGERTVETHLSHAYAKLGVRGRNELK